MNAQRKKAAVKAYADQLEGKSKQDVIDLLNADEKNYTSDEVVEIVDELFSDKPGPQQKSSSLNRQYEEWKVKPLYEKQRGDDGTMRNVCVGFEKDAQKHIRITNITPERAALLNMHSENTLVHLYEVE